MKICITNLSCLCSDNDTPSGPSQSTAVQQPLASHQLPPSSSGGESSPRKSYLSGAAAVVAGAAYAKSPLKAASDRILRKYTSPMKKRQSLREGIRRRRPMFSPVKAGAVTPRRIVALAPALANRGAAAVAKSGGLLSPCPPVGRTPPQPSARCRGSPALVSPRYEDQDTPTAAGRRKTRHQKVPYRSYR